MNPCESSTAILYCNYLSDALGLGQPTLVKDLSTPPPNIFFVSQVSAKPLNERGSLSDHQIANGQAIASWSLGSPITSLHCTETGKGPRPQRVTKGPTREVMIVTHMIVWTKGDGSQRVAGEIGSDTASHDLWVMTCDD